MNHRPWVKIERKHMNSNDIRHTFLNFFAKYDHKVVSSAPVVPIDDPTLLFTNAGMHVP